ncbi:MAG: arsenate reductase ArsC [Methylophilaceae bacterium]
MDDKVYNVLFLCTGNSARSIMAEKLMDKWGHGQFKAYSAGSFPTGKVNPFAIKTLKLHGLSTEGLRSKSWDEFSGPDAPHLDFIFTVCDNAAGEVCPVWLSHPMTAHWGVEDPAAVEGSDENKLDAFCKVSHSLENRIKLFVSLSLSKLDNMMIKEEIDAIGKA